MKTPRIDVKESGFLFYSNETLRNERMKVGEDQSNISSRESGVIEPIETPKNTGTIRFV